MPLSKCNRCTTAFAAGLAFCPQCRSTDFEEEGTVAKVRKEGRVKVTDKNAAPGETGYIEPPTQELVEDDKPYYEWTVNELKEEVAARNEDRDEDDKIVTGNLKADLVAALEDDDEGADEDGLEPTS
jgi:hypothetical protein